MKLEVVVIPVSDVDRAKRFYLSMGWRLDADFASGDSWRVLQVTPPGSACSSSSARDSRRQRRAPFRDCFSAVDDSQCSARRAHRIRRRRQRACSTSRAASISPGPRVARRGRIRKVAPISRLLHSTIRMATAGYFKRSRRGFPDGAQQPGRRDTDTASAGGERSTMASTRRLLRSTTGRGGTPPTSSRASAAGLPRKPPKMLAATWNPPVNEGITSPGRSAKGRATWRVLFARGRRRPKLSIARRIPHAAMPSRAAILTRSGRLRANILRVSLPRCAFTVISLMPSSNATCLFRRPATTSVMTSPSRRVRDA